LPSTAKFKAVPSREGDIWLAGDTGLFHSTDSGATFTRVSTMSSARSVGFGKAAPGQTYNATIRGDTSVESGFNGSWAGTNPPRRDSG